MQTQAFPQPVDRRLLEEDILPHVFKPARYLGLEQGAYRKSFTKSAVTMAVAFPDLYEIGFSNYGLKLLYSLVNQQPKYMCDRVYAPAPDFKEKLLDNDLPLYGVESFVPLRDFDLLAFSLQYELNYTTIFGLLETAQIPFRATERAKITKAGGTPDWPILIAGGPGSANPMPLSPFFDAFIIGDGEHVLLEILDTIDQGKKQKLSRIDVLKNLAKLEGLFMPGYNEKSSKRIVDIAVDPVELAPLIPLIGAVHDRVTIEARRGCDRMCRFCQPCFINLPVREQSIENIKTSALKEIEKTGYEECSLLSLSIADYSYFKPLILEVAEALKEENVSLSLPSQRADRFSIDVAEAVQSVRKSTLTFAPEAGTTRLRDVINKNLTDAEIMDAVTNAYKAGWNKVKLYFIIGLPTETHDDLDGIVDIITRMQAACRDIKRDPTLSVRSHLEINVTLSNFVPKPHTPFQWFPQDTMEQLHNKIKYLRDQFRPFKGVKLNFTDPEISKLEGVISKGGPELADVIEDAYRNGAYLDAWDDLRNFDKWFTALEKHGIHYEEYTRDRACDPDGPLPWDVIDVGLTKQWLKTEYDKATAASSTTPCFEECSVCGVCSTYSTWPKFIETPAAKNEKRVENALSDTDVVAVHQTKKEPAIKVRLLMEKKGPLRFISHLDWLRMIYRAISRAGLPVAYSQGFNPKPRVSFGPALPLFTESLCEYVDIDLTETVHDVTSLLNPYMPANGQIYGERLVPMTTPSIDSCIVGLTYTAKSSGSTACTDESLQSNMTTRVKFLKSQATLPIEVETKKSRKKPNSKKALDLVPYLENLDVDDDGTVRFTLRRFSADAGRDNAVPTDGSDEGEPAAVSGAGSAKPSWVLGLIDSTAQWSVVRTHIAMAPGAPSLDVETGTAGAGAHGQLPAAAR